MSRTELPLAGTSVLTLAGLGPVPYASMLLADLGCDVTIVDRIQSTPASMPAADDPRRRGQRSIAIDLRTVSGREIAERLVVASDVLIEGMRPGAVDRLGLGPVRCHELNPGLIFARITGWGQSGPYSTMAGHDINYVGLTGALHALGEPGSAPPVPLNLVGDYAGGSTFAVCGILAALLERVRSGRGQVVDAAIVDGVVSLCTATLGMQAAGLWHGRGENAFDGSRPWYRTYETSDGGFVAVGAIEPQFYAELLSGLGFDPADWPRETAEDISRLGERLTATFRSETRSHWVDVFDGSDACVTPVLTFEEAPSHAQALARDLFVATPKGLLPSPAPRFDRTPLVGGGAPAAIGAHTQAILAELGLRMDEIAQLRAESAVL